MGYFLAVCLMRYVGRSSYLCVDRNTGKMKKLKFLFKILKTTGLWHLIMGFVSFFLLSGLIICFVEPTIDNYGDALWYLFVSFTTIGYGDFAAQNIIGRAVTVVVSLYGILIVAFIPAVILSYITEVSKNHAEKSLMELLDKLERLPELSREELEEISRKVKDIKKEL